MNPDLTKDNGMLDENKLVSHAVAITEGLKEANMAQSTDFTNSLLKTLATLPPSKVMELIERHG